MSWQDRLNNTVLTIITGDGEIYEPLWKSSERNLIFNTKNYGFVNLNGTYVARKTFGGNTYPIELWFEGENCIDVVNNFEISTRDPRPWKLKHPFLDDEINIQPSSLKINTSGYNVAKVTGTVTETLLVQYPDEIVSTKKEIKALKSANDLEVAATFVENIPVAESSLVQKVTDAISAIGANYEILAANDTDIAALKNLVRSAAGAASNIITSSSFFIQQTTALINFPFQVVQTVASKFNALIENLDDLKLLLFGSDATDQSKQTYEALTNVTLSELSLNAVSPISDDNTANLPADYETRSSVTNAITALNAAYDDILETFDDNDYQQDSELAQQLDNITYQSVANLFEIAFNAKQERTISLNKDSNIIVQSHKYYGPGDDAIKQFVDINAIALEEYLGLKKGREIVYFV